MTREIQRESRSLKSVVNEMNSVAGNVQEVLGQAVIDLEEVIGTWDEVSYAVGTSDQWKADETVNEMQRKLILISERLQRGSRLLK